MSKLVTKQSLLALIEKDPIRVVGRALVVIFNNQLPDEQAKNTTNKHNLTGFTGADSRSGCISAKYYLKHKTLLDWQLERWLTPNKNGTPRIAKYWRQLNEAANLKLQNN